MENKNEICAAFVCEQTLDTQKVKITHIENKPGLHFIRFPACLQTYDCWNRNNRNYHLAPMKKSWAAPHVQELIQRGDFFGENGHPDSNSPKRIVTIDPKVACHRIKRIWFKGNAVYGDIETLNDDLYGKQFMMHVLQCCEAAFSLRALVPLTKIDAVRSEIKQPGHIIAVDRVILPSHKDAYQVPGDIEMVQSTQGLESSAFGTDETKMYIPKGQTNEDSELPVTESSDWIDYILEESFNLKTVMNNFDVNAESIHYDKNTDSVIVHEAADPSTKMKRSVIVKMDDYIRDEVSSMFSKF